LTFIDILPHLKEEGYSLAFSVNQLVVFAICIKPLSFLLPSQIEPARDKVAQ
jgi:hypothetical protein